MRATRIKMNGEERSRTSPTYRRISSWKAGRGRKAKQSMARKSRRLARLECAV